jgi:hypothetical protein
VTPPPHSLPPVDLPSLGDIFSLQAGIFVGAHRPKRPQTETGLLTGSPSLPRLTLVSRNLQGMIVVLVVMRIAHLLGPLQVPLSLSAARVAAAMVVMPFLLGSGGAEPPSKRARPWSFLSVTSQYAHGVVHWFTLLPLLLYLFIL